MGASWYVIGGGIIGLLSAYELHLAGESVVVLDRQAVGREASWAGGGILSPLYPWRYPEAVEALAHLSQMYYEALASTLKRDSGIDPEWTRSGLLILDEDDSESGLIWCEKHNIVAESVDSRAVSAIEPQVSMRSNRALNLPNVAQIRNPRLLKAVVECLRSAGVEFRENTAVTGFEVRRGVLASILSESGAIPAERCLLAAGPWSAHLLRTTGIDLPLRPVKGQMLALIGSTIPFRHLLLRESCYLIPRRDGRILVGSTQEETGFDRTTNATAREMLFSKAVELVPELGNWKIEHHWAGLRPGSPEGIPYIGQHPEIQGLFVNTGHFRNGIVLAPASAKLVVDLMLGRSSSLDPRQYSLVRA
ncbi:MAG: glycine oxidase ThiO [Acidiferrobacterales bacterium]